MAAVLILAVSPSAVWAQHFSRTDQITYHDNPSTWVMGQTASTTNINTGVTEYRVDFDSASALPSRYYGAGTGASPGLLKQTVTYNADGTVATVKDGNNHVTTLSNWKRGIPQTIQYPATQESPSGATQSAVVNDSGWITSITDENGYTTGYTYDAMGRVASINHPAGDNVAWNAETFTFTPIQADEHGLAAGHWTMRHRVGNRHVNTYYDALWRPVLEESLDYADVGGTLSQVVKRYDTKGRLIFQSYPQRGVVNYWEVIQGVRTEYDALDRVISVSQDSEHGPLITRTQYQADFKTQLTNPRNQQTTTSYMAYDQPSYEWPIAIIHPEGAYTDIDRDVFGKPTSLKRRNGTDSLAVTRGYAYDVHQRLCRSVEPETGATLLGYDGADNLAWSAAGLPGATACDPTGNSAEVAARKAARTYDARNRIKTLAFPDGKGDQAWTYTPDGKPAIIATRNAPGGDTVVNNYAYNRRGLPVSESISLGSQQWTTGYRYDANGQLASHLYPEGMAVEYAPNALGQPTRAGNHATGVSYFPNGAVQQFTYGNGIVHSLTQNARGLPERSRDAYGGTAVHDDSLDFDYNGNVAAITDGLAGARGNRDMSYDGLDRLTGVTSPMFGAATYTYDVLDNLKSVRLTTGPKVRDHAYVYDANFRLSNVTAAGGATVVGLGYDAQGNLANKNGVLYSFDYGNRLREVTGTEQYLYDGHGRRVQSIRDGASIYSVYGQDGVLRFQRDERVGKSIAYVYLAGSLVAQVKDPIALSTPWLTAPGYSSSGSYTVSWTTAAVAIKYQLQERASGGSWATTHDAAGLSKAISGKAAGSYEYQVRACSATTCGGWSAIAITTVQLPPAGVPSLNVPSAGLNGSYPVSWTAVAAAESYQLQERLGSGAWSTVHDAVGTNVAISGKAAGSWSYQVRACNVAGCGAYSAIATVQVTHPPASAPTLTVPASNYNGAYTVSWTAVGTSASYEVEERLGSGGWTQIHNAIATSKAVSDKTAGGWGYRVRACNPAGCSAYSAIGTVQVILPPSGAPALTVPVSSYTGSYSVSWTGIAAATSYPLEEQVNGGGWALIQDSAAATRALSGKAAAAYGYRVRACNVAGCGAYSAVGTVQVTLPPASAPALSVPGSNTTGSYSVSWTGIAAATSYPLEEQVDGGGWAQIQDTGATSRSVTGKGAGSFGYRVRACNLAGCSAYSGVGTVQVTLPLTAPTISGPATATTDYPYTLTWAAIAGASRYELLRSRNNGAWLVAQDSAATSISVHGAGGTYLYQVRACTPTACSPYSALHKVVVTATNN